MEWLSVAVFAGAALLFVLVFAGFRNMFSIRPGAKFAPGSVAVGIGMLTLAGIALVIVLTR